ncbi:nuclear transport factor 2 family protein [Rhodococcus zopfii]|uniref:nuclear transport factor 2 family protein n=1 Tax=Rhodococcus zopfii TaxID=43772 RepID=UPI003528E311
MGWSHSELEDAFALYQQASADARRTGDWSLFSDRFTEDARYYEHAYGRFEGRDAIREWVIGTMGAFPGNRMTAFPANWSVVDADRGWVIAEIDNPMEDPGDGSHHAAANITILHYGGDGLWCYEEDAYNPMNFLRMAQGWCRAAQDAGTLPEDARIWWDRYGR